MPDFPPSGGGCIGGEKQACKMETADAADFFDEGVWPDVAPTVTRRNDGSPQPDIGTGAILCVTISEADA